ncbi:MAG: VOC family protein [Firmicutes bacterium]|nr:VOC family protein [Bacillota bacterium]
MKFKMVHNNFNVSNLDKSLRFYQEALGLVEQRRIRGNDFTIVFLGNGESSHRLELTCNDDHPHKYNLGDNEFHFAFETDDIANALKKHKEMGVVCYENQAMGIYFIVDPDGYWLEIVPAK